MHYLSGKGIHEKCEEPVEGDQCDIDGVAMEVSMKQRQLVLHQLSHHSLQVKVKINVNLGTKVKPGSKIMPES